MFSNEWEQGYAEGSLMQPLHYHAELMWMFQVFAPTFQAMVLELGCGSGQNVGFWEDGRGKWYGVDGSQTAITELHKRFPAKVDYAKVADFTKDIPFDGEFDLVFDRASVSHNTYDGMQSAVNLASKALKPGGLYIGADWFADDHSESIRGDVVDDVWTRTNYPDGQFRGVGVVRFCGSTDIWRLFQGFDLYMLRKRTIQMTLTPSNFYWISQAFSGHQYKSSLWDFVARKK